MFNDMNNKIFLSEQLLKILMTGKRVAGSIYVERVGNEVVVRFRPYQRSRTKRRHDQTLLALPHGWIRKSPRRYRLNVSLPDHLGERRVGELMAGEALEAQSYMNALESVLNNV